MEKGKVSISVGVPGGPIGFMRLIRVGILHGRPCRSPLCWTEVGESSITGPDLIRDTSDKVILIRQRLLTA